MVEQILEIARTQSLDRQQVLQLLAIPVGSAQYYQLLQTADAWARKQFEQQGKIFAQIGIDCRPCSVDCKFCSMAKSAMSDERCNCKSIEQVVQQARQLCEQGVSDLFLMTTADFSQTEFLAYGKAVKAVLPQQVRLVANVGDFQQEYAQQLKKVGFTGVYHICRLGEGVDTKVEPWVRVRTLDAVKQAGLELYYCVEPIGPEHTDEQLAQEMLRVRDYPVGVMAVMKRVAVPGTALAERGEITAARLAQICAVATLAAKPPRAMCVHEPDELSLMAGANQLYAEIGTNPRDLAADTKTNRGFSVADARKMLWNTNWNWSGTL